MRYVSALLLAVSVAFSVGCTEKVKEYCASSDPVLREAGRAIAATQGLSLPDYCKLRGYPTPDDTGTQDSTD